jgi:hypothetical protein
VDPFELEEVRNEPHPICAACWCAHYDSDGEDETVMFH